jgi:hypothetical protein
VEVGSRDSSPVSSVTGNCPRTSDARNFRSVNSMGVQGISVYVNFMYVSFL